MVKPGPKHAHPAHANVWPRMPEWTPRSRRLLVGAVIVAGSLCLFAGATGAADRVTAAPLPAPPSSAGTTVPGEHAGGPVTLPALPPAGAPTPVPAHQVIPRPTQPPRPTGPAVTDLAGDGIPVIALRAYQLAAARANALDPGCGIPWPLLAAIGRVESDHGRFADSQLYSDGTSAPRIIGIPLNGHGTALIRDTDGGLLDGDKVYDRAVGPMQFIPSTWARWGVDGNGDHVISPFNIYDAAAAAADYLCDAGGNLRTEAGQIQAVLSYNHSDAYVALVLALEKAYAAGVRGVSVPNIGPNPTPPPGAKPVLPPVNPAPPLDITTPRTLGGSATALPTSPGTSAPGSSSPGSSAPGSSTSASATPTTSAPGTATSSSSPVATPTTPATSLPDSSTSATPTSSCTSTEPTPTDTTTTPTDSLTPTDTVTSTDTPTPSGSTTTTTTGTTTTSPTCPTP